MHPNIIRLKICNHIATSLKKSNEEKGMFEVNISYPKLAIPTTCHPEISCHVSERYPIVLKA
jgi:hypothetical protein